ncbi:MAG: DEAD/DEAH box helicase [Bdellovibrionota bacterium]
MSIFRQFSAQNWQNGISIYRSGAVCNFKTYDELASVRVKTGIGESFDVRIKLHTSGRFVQWMECTCQANRRRGEKCAHIAAFCFYLCHEKKDYLKQLNIEPGEIDDYFTLSLEKQVLKEEASSSPFDFKEKMGIIHEAKSILKENSIENIFSKNSVEIISIDLDKEEPWVNVTAKIDENKTLNYRFGVDDTCKLFFHTNYANKVSKNLQKLINEKFVAKRAFEVVKNGQHGLTVSRIINLETDKKTQKRLKVAEMPGSHIGRIGVFETKIGYVPFDDDMTPLQISRWNEFPKTANLEGDQAASLIENKFSRLKESADVILEGDINKTVIYEKIFLPEFSLKKTLDGTLFVDAKLGTSDEKINSQFSSKNTILDILKARAEGKKYIQTEKGFIKVTKEFDWLKNNLQEDGQLKLSTIEFIRFHEQFGKDSQINGKVDVIDKLRAGLVSRQHLPLPNLDRTNLQLRPYQEDGLKWLWWLYTNSLGGLLADEMGLGKTHQAMALISAIANQEQNSLFLVVCPTTVIDHWLDKMKAFVPNIHCICYHGSARKHYLQQLVKNSSPVVFVTSYGILLRDIELLMQVKWNINILDEAHLVKNQSSRTYRAACRIKSNMRLCLTGTPLENDLFELKNLFDYIAPNYLGSDSEFKKKYISLDENNDPVPDLELHRLIHPFKMRRNKLEVLTDLPEKVEDVRHCHLNSVQKKLYQDTLSLKGSRLISELQDAKNPVPFIHIFSLISLLKQICDDPALIDPQYENIGSGKLNLFDELIAEALESDQKVVVFSQYAKMIYRLSNRLNSQNISHVTLTGQSQHRGKIVRDFQENKNIKVFLGSLLAGGTGIDLTAANIVIHFDRWWNAAKEDQATDRIHRIGQIKNVQVYKLITKGTLEERIDGIITRKKLIFERFVEKDEDIFKHLSREDLLQLLKDPVEEDFV